MRGLGGGTSIGRKSARKAVVLGVLAAALVTAAMPSANAWMRGRARWRPHFAAVYRPGPFPPPAFYRLPPPFPPPPFAIYGPPPPPPMRPVAPFAANAPPPPAPREYLVFFDWDRYAITPAGMTVIRRAAADWRSGAPVRIRVNGYTDLSGPVGYNVRLSLRRANAVASALMRRGVPRGEMAVRGLGESNPRVPTARGVREPQNRRVEITFQRAPYPYAARRLPPAAAASRPWATPGFSRSPY